MFATLRRSYIDAQRPGPLSLMGRIGFQPQATMGAQAVFHAVVGARRVFFRSAAEAIVRRYATYCGSSPFDGACDTDAGRPCRTGWRLAGGRRHAWSGANHGTLAVELGVRIRYGEGVDSIETGGGGVTGVTLGKGGERLVADRVIFNGDISAPCPTSRPVADIRSTPTRG
jgi:1-hydroxycarotenoid 3,4-desaturase